MTVDLSRLLDPQQLWSRHEVLATDERCPIRQCRCLAVHEVPVPVPIDRVLHAFGKHQKHGGAGHVGWLHHSAATSTPTRIGSGSSLASADPRMSPLTPSRTVNRQ